MCEKIYVKTTIASGTIECYFLGIESTQSVNESHFFGFAIIVAALDDI